MRLAAQRLELLARGGKVGRLVEQPAVAGQRRIRADHEGAGMPRRDAHRLHLGQRRGDVLRRGALAQEAALHLVLVDARRLDRESEAGIGEKLAAGGAGGGEDEGAGMMV